MNLSELINIEQLRDICESITYLTGSATAILDLDGNILIATGWQNICTDFHRVNPKTSERCTISDTVLASRLEAGENFNVYRCKNGMVDVAIPIFIGGEHIANFFTGQFFFEPPDREFFIQQAKQYGFDETSYLAALDKVPIFSEEYIKTFMHFFIQITRLVGETGFEKMNLEIVNAELKRTGARLKEQIFENKTSMEMLKNSERILEDFINFIPDAIFAIDLNGRVIIWNKAAEEITGVKRRDIISKGNYEYSIPFYGERRPILIDLVFMDNDEIRNQYPYIEKKGDKVFGEAYTKHAIHGAAYMWGIASPLYDSKGEVIGAIETVRDITDRKRTEEVLRERDIQLNSIINCSPVSQFVIDQNHQVIYWNRTLEGISGIKSEEVIGTNRHWLAFYNEERPCLADLLLDGNFEMIPEWYKGKFSKSKYLENAYEATDSFMMGDSKKWLFFTAALIKDLDGTITGAVETLEDITDRKEAEEAILASNELFRSVMRAATSYAIIGTTPDGIITLFNEGAEMMLGFTADDVIGKATPLLFHEPSEIADRALELGIKPGHEIFFAEARKGETETREWTYIKKDGSRIFASLTVAAMKNESGEFKGFIGISRDITAEKKMEQQLIQSQKMESIGLLAGGIAHDFNNLLTPIIGYTDMLASSFDKDDPKLKKLQQINRAALRAKDLTHRLLAFSRKQVIELKIVDLGDVIRQIEPMLRRMIRENISIEVFIPPRTCRVRIDLVQIEQVIINLAVNSQDSMPGGGTLTIEISDIDLDESYTSIHPEIIPGRYIMLSVSDTGSGIDNSLLDHIFEPFFTTKEPGKGTGLGLSMVYGIVRQHGGSISVYSEKNRGSVFKIFLPCASYEINEDTQTHKSAEITHGIETILVVEDSETVRMLACDMLQELGYNILAAATPEQSVEIVKTYNGSITLLLTDVVMPGMNGKELYELLVKILPGLKVLFMSGYASNIIGRHGIISNDVNFIQKPFSLHSLSESIRHAIDS